MSLDHIGPESILKLATTWNDVLLTERIHLIL